MKVAVIGCGYWGKNLVRNFHELGALAAVSDNNSDTGAQFSQRYNVPFLSIDEIASSSAIDGVVIATPAILHAQLAKKFLESGKHVFVEKPLALDLDDAKELCEIASQKKLSLFVGHVLQYHPAFIKIQQLVRDGLLGKIHYLSSTRTNFGKIRTEENILWSFAPHDLSMILAIAGSQPVNVWGRGHDHLNKTIADRVTVHIDFESGLSAQIEASWLHPLKQQCLIVAGDQGMIVFDDTKPWAEKLQLFRHQVRWEGTLPHAEKSEGEYLQVEEKEPLKEECLAFINSMSSNQQAPTDGNEGLRVLEVLQAAQKSMVMNTSIQIKGDPLEKSTDHYVHESAYVDEDVTIGKGSKIWHFSHICKGADIGRDVIIGQNVMVGPEVKIADACKLQNNVSIYKGVELAEGVFCGPSCVFTNVNTPRAQIERKNEFLATPVGKSATIGANATIVCGNKIGEYSLIAAGAVVTKDVLPHALMAGVPARQIGWVSHAGEVLREDMVCPREGRRYKVEDSILKEIKDEPILKSA